ncbi:hypothetical protein PAXINDRAFT_15215 [Paxillus involutus ATCC 200175]|uniref:Uncharacterized protein n=1 Tax=Paxillus involutus ATCC 200175 TaxID=664439 RepID=A0A0C9T891_PAXIN|nr:hypothetical protein PAXINDRAFT_15215 [Paxillus involutus ATCC 200175]
MLGDACELLAFMKGPPALRGSSAVSIFLPINTPETQSGYCLSEDVPANAPEIAEPAISFKWSGGHILRDGPRSPLEAQAQAERIWPPEPLKLIC